MGRTPGSQGQTPGFPGQTPGSPGQTPGSPGQKTWSQEQSPGSLRPIQGFAGISCSQCQKVPQHSWCLLVHSSYTADLSWHQTTSLTGGFLATQSQGLSLYVWFQTCRSWRWTQTQIQSETAVFCPTKFIA